PSAPLPVRLRRAGLRVLATAPLPLGPVTPLSQGLFRYALLGPAVPPERVEFCTRVLHACPATVRARWASVLARLDLDEHAARFDVPAVILVGSADRLT